jgi:hypothetical protein
VSGRNIIHDDDDDDDDDGNNNNNNNFTLSENYSEAYKSNPDQIVTELKTHSGNKGTKFV